MFLQKALKEAGYDVMAAEGSERASGVVPKEQAYIWL
jgi:hypothetical protein